MTFCLVLVLFFCYLYARMYVLCTTNVFFADSVLVSNLANDHQVAMHVGDGWYSSTRERSSTTNTELRPHKVEDLFHLHRTKLLHLEPMKKKSIKVELLSIVMTSISTVVAPLR